MACKKKRPHETFYTSLRGSLIKSTAKKSAREFYNYVTLTKDDQRHGNRTSIYSSLFNRVFRKEQLNED